MGVEDKVKTRCLTCQTYTKDPKHSHCLCYLEDSCPAWVDPKTTCKHDWKEYYYSGSDMLGMQCTKCGLQDPSTWRKKVWK